MTIQQSPRMHLLIPLQHFLQLAMQNQGPVHSAGQVFRPRSAVDYWEDALQVPVESLIGFVPSSLIKGLNKLVLVPNER